MQEHDVHNQGESSLDHAKRAWSPQEDEKLRAAVTQYGPQRWALIAGQLEGRKDKQCRERWFNHLSPQVKKGDWTKEEDELIMKSVAELGTCWSRIVKRLPGRTDHAIKNRYNSTIRRQERAKRAAMPPQQRQWIVGNAQVVGQYRSDSPQVLRPSYMQAPSVGQVIGVPPSTYAMPMRLPYGMPVQEGMHSMMMGGAGVGAGAMGYRQHYPSPPNYRLDRGEGTHAVDPAQQVEADFLQLASDLAAISSGPADCPPQPEIVDALISQMRSIAGELAEYRGTFKRPRPDEDVLADLFNDDYEQHHTRESSELSGDEADGYARKVGPHSEGVDGQSHSTPGFVSSPTTPRKRRD